MAVIEAVVTINVNEEKLKEEGVTVQQVVNDMIFLDDDVVDGVVLQRGGVLGDIASDFYLSAGSIKTIEVLEEK